MSSDQLGCLPRWKIYHWDWPTRYQNPSSIWLSAPWHTVGLASPSVSSCWISSRQALYVLCCPKAILFLLPSVHVSVWLECISKILLLCHNVNLACVSFFLRWLLPFIGHMGICTSTGVIRDFAGPYFVSVSNSCSSVSVHILSLRRCLFQQVTLMPNTYSSVLNWTLKCS